MSFLKNIFSKKKESQDTVGGLEDFMLLIRVYLQSAIASQTGVNNLSVMPDLRIFKQTYHVATLNNKIGLAEKKHCKKLLQNIYNLSDEFFKEVDLSIKKRCTKLQDVQPYSLQFQDFCQISLQLMSNLKRWQLMLPSFFRSAIRTMIEKQIHECMTRNDWKEADVRHACAALRKYQSYLGYSEAWMTEFVHTCIMLGKKEKQPKNAE